MRLSLLSNGYYSDSICDAAPMIFRAAPKARGAAHFAALLRGVMVLAVFAVTFGLTFLEESRMGQGLEAEAAEARAVR